MAPQPLSRVHPTANYQFGTAVFQQFPELGASAIRVINVGSMIEFRWSLMLVDLLRADPKTGMAMYMALSSSEARRAALMAAAKSRLPEEDFQIFQCVLRATAPQRKQRNEFAHHLWGISPELPDSILLIDPEHFADLFIGVHLSNEKMFRSKKLVMPPELDRGHIQVYSKKALEIANRRMDEAMMMVSDLGGGITHGRGREIDDPLRQKLLARPLIARGLRRLKTRSDP